MRTNLALLAPLGGAALAALVASAPACTSTPAEAPTLSPAHGADGGGDNGGEDGGGATTAPAPIGVGLFGAACAPGSPKVNWSPMRRISRVEYDNMVRDLLGDTTGPAQTFVPESPMASGVNFETNTYAGVSELIAQQYQQAAETLAQTAVASASTLSAILPCQTQDDACATQFIQAFANRAFRGGLDADEATALFGIYSAVKAQFDFPTGIQAIVTSVLESPRFLYVIELGSGQTTGSVIPLSHYEIAGRLALFLWRSVPDAALMQAAGAGQLATAAQVAAQATRMLADPKAKGALDDFTTQWVQLQDTATVGKDTQFTAWNANSKIGTEMRDETLANVSQLVLSANGSFPDLLTSPASYINQDLATFYGAPLGAGPTISVSDSALGGATTFVSTSLPNRAGILTNGSIQATQAHTTLPSSVLRGKLVREDVLCDPLPPPPPGIPPAPTSVPDGGTTRSVFQAHATEPGCVGCHQYMDPIGYGFGHFDASGAYQATDANGQEGSFPSIDATGQVIPTTTGDFQASYDGAIDLVTQLSTAKQAQECFALQEIRYALSRIETADDACSAQQIWSAFTGGSLNIQTLLVGIVQSDAFRYRSIETAGSACQ